MLVSILFLVIGMAAIILLTTLLKMHPFFALLIACFIVGLGIGLPAAEVLAVSKDGFGNILKSLGFILVLGTTLGLLLEHTGSTHVMASYLLRKVGEARAPLAMSITGFIVGLPIFCDSGYIVLSGLNKALARRTGTSMVVMAVSMATGLYSVHCLIPPHPGATAAAAVLGVDYGRLILFGTLVAIPAMLAGYCWAVYAGKKYPSQLSASPSIETPANTPAVVNAFLPILVPIVLIAVRSFFNLEGSAATGWRSVLFLGDPVPALGIGILLALFCKKKWTRTQLSSLLSEGAEKAGSILVIIGAGGAFGAVLAAAKLGTHINGLSVAPGFGLLVAFLLTVVLKTAQGSSTVAIITAASILQPLLPTLGISTESDKLFAVLAMGAGSMTISHANDAYFWVIARFSDLPINTMLRVYSVATMLMAGVSLLLIYLLSMWLH